MYIYPPGDIITRQFNYNSKIKNVERVLEKEDLYG